MRNDPTIHVDGSGRIARMADADLVQTALGVSGDGLSVPATNIIEARGVLSVPHDAHDVPVHPVWRKVSGGIFIGPNPFSRQKVG